MRFQTYIAATFLVALPLAAAARPASPELMSHVNSDGKAIEFRLFGDDSFSYMTDAKGVQILEFNNSGNLVPAMRDGVRLRAVDADINRLRAENTYKGFELNDNRNRMAALEPNGANRGRTTFPSIGNDIRSVVILLEFPDSPYISDNPKEQYWRLCNEPGYSDYKAVGSARDYYEACSNGQFTPHFDVYGPVRLDHPSSYYTEDYKRPGEPKRAWGKQPRFGEAIKQAIEELDPTVDFSQYDYDKNGEIDNIFFFFSGTGQADTADETKVWPHQSDYRAYTAYNSHPLDLPYLTPDGVKVTCYACSNEINSSRMIPAKDKPFLDGIGAFCHEFAHVLGLPDLYDTNTANGNCKTPGNFSVMDHGSYNELSTRPPLFSAYEQWLCKWIEYIDATDGESYKISPMTDKSRSAVRLRIRQSGGTISYHPEYYVVETRRPEGWDSSLPEHGMMIWRINFNNKTWSANTVNDRTPNVEIISPDDESTTWPGMEEAYTYISPATKNLTPACLSYSVWDATLTNISYNSTDGTASFDFNKYLPSNEAPVMNDHPTAKHKERQIVLSWSPMEGISEYMLTVTRTDESTGNTYFVDGYNETPVDTHYCFVRNITEKQWNQTFRAKVRIFNGVPANVTSNEIVFVPAELAEYDPNNNSGVAEAGIDMPVIYGAAGYIVAPEYARVFTLGGVECGRENLPAGVYLVVAGGVRAKVMVR